MSDGKTMHGLPSSARSSTAVARLINRAWATVPPAIAMTSPATYSYLTSLSLAIAMYSAYVARLRATSTIGTSVARVAIFGVSSDFSAAIGTPVRSPGRRPARPNVLDCGRHQGDRQSGAKQTFAFLQSD